MGRERARPVREPNKKHLPRRSPEGLTTKQVPVFISF